MRKIKINLREDFENIILNNIKADNFLSVSQKTPKQKKILKYLEYQRKLGFAGPHKIEKSSDFECPDECKEGLEKLMGIFRNGGDIRPYLNRTSANLDDYDDMFADWGILHFHLGSFIPKNDIFVERGKYVLFAYIHDKTVYMVNIYDHNHWADTDVLQTIYNNWPQIIKPYIMKGAAWPNVSIEYKDRIKLRKSGFVTMIPLENKKGKKFIIIPPSLGQTTARTSIVDTRYYQMINTRLLKIENALKTNENSLIKDYNLPKNDFISLKLKELKDNKLELIEEMSGKLIALSLI